MDGRELGTRGESLACAFLQAHGLEIVERNWRCELGEIDIVAFDPDHDCTVFIEVKSRAGLGFGDPLEAITHAKVRKLRSLVGEYVARRHPRGAIRLDAVGVLVRRGYRPVITHIEGIGA